jgi:hypothetical protein
MEVVTLEEGCSSDIIASGAAGGLSYFMAIGVVALQPGGVVSLLLKSMPC